MRGTTQYIWDEINHILNDPGYRYFDGLPPYLRNIGIILDLSRLMNRLIFLNNLEIFKYFAKENDFMLERR